MQSTTVNRLSEVANLYNKQYGMMVLPVEGISHREDWKTDLSYKTPAIDEHSNFFSQFINGHDVLNSDYDWGKSTGICLCLGCNDYWCITVIFNKFFHHNVDVKSIHNEILNLLSLPQDYAWIVWSSDLESLSVIFRSQTVNREPLSDGELYFETENGTGSISICLKTKGFTMLPPSIDKNGFMYDFYDREPDDIPQIVSVDNVVNLLINYFSIEDVVDIHHNGVWKYLHRTAIFHDCDRDIYDNIRYHTCDEIPLLGACCNNDVVNSLGVVYAKSADNMDYITKAKYYSKAAECFRRANTNESLDNLRQLKSLELIPIEADKKYSSDIETELGYHYLSYLRHRGYKYLFVDTETTGLPKDYREHFHNTDNWPRIIQIAWMCVDSYGRILHKESKLIKPVGFVIPDVSTRVHGISTAKAVDYGTYIEDVIPRFESFLDTAEFVVGHNIDFDMDVIASEYTRISGGDSGGFDECGEFNFPTKNIVSKPRICTMKSSTSFCRILLNNDYKYPKLEELYQSLFREPIKGAHDALIDVEATVRCFNELRSRGEINDNCCYYSERKKERP